MTVRILLFALLILATTSVWAHGRAQTNIERAASSDMDELRTWKDLDAWRKKYAPKYDDGFYAEGISDFVERMLAGNWQSLSELVSLSATSPGLFEFAVSHLGDITGCESAKTIVGSSISKCQSGLQAYCKRIQDALVPGAAPECLPELNPALKQDAPSARPFTIR